MQEVTALAVADNGDEKEFTFELHDNATDKEKLDKAFEIAYCEIFYNLKEVSVID